MSVARDDSGTNKAFALSATSLNLTTFTVGTGGNAFLVAIIDFAFGTLPTGVSVTWNGVALTEQISQTATNVRVHIFTLVAPATGNQTLAVTWTGTANCSLGVINFSGVDQTTPLITADTTSASGSSTSPALTVTSDTNGATLVGVAHENGLTADDQTRVFMDNNVNGAGGTYALGGISNVHTWTAAATGNWATAGVHVQQVQGAAPNLTFAARAVQSSLRW